jgi:hypothetical protein
VVILFVLTVALAAANLLYSARQTAADNRNWHQALTQMQQQLCGVVAPFATAPVQKPTSPAQKATATQYAWHQRFVSLSHSFHCQEVTGAP